MRDDLRVLCEEMLKACDVGEDEMITGGVLVMRAKNMKSGRTSVVMGQTEDTDGVVMLGLMHAAIEIQAQEEWRQPDDD